VSTTWASLLVVDWRIVGEVCNILQTFVYPVFDGPLMVCSRR
jgi:hypothetical protein